MLDRAVVEEFLEAQFDEMDWDLPQGTEKEELVEEFCRYVMRDYYEWLQDNFKSFFSDRYAVTVEPYDAP